MHQAVSAQARATAPRIHLRKCRLSGKFVCRKRGATIARLWCYRAAAGKMHGLAAVDSAPLVSVRSVMKLALRFLVALGSVAASPRSGTAGTLLGQECGCTGYRIVQQDGVRPGAGDHVSPGVRDGARRAAGDDAAAGMDHRGAAAQVHGRQAGDRNGDPRRAVSSSAGPVDETEYREEAYDKVTYLTETEMRQEKYLVQRPVVETQMREQQHTVRRPIQETMMQDQSYTVRRAVQETVMQQQAYTAYQPVTSYHTQLVDQGQYVNTMHYQPGALALPFDVRAARLSARSGDRHDDVLSRRPAVGAGCRARRLPGATTYMPNIVTQQVPTTSYQPATMTQEVPVTVTRYQDEVVNQQVPVQVTRIRMKSSRSRFRCRCSGWKRTRKFARSR